jgi:hypothetical protein
MLKPIIICLLIALVALTLPGCSVITGESIGGPAGEEIPVNTEFGRMLRYVPASVFEEHDLWFGNPELVKKINELEDFKSIDEAMAWVEEMKKQAEEDWPEEVLKKAWGGLSEAGLSGLNIVRWPELYGLVGFDVMSVDRIIYGDVIPPHGFSVLEGEFDEAVIGQKLMELGYTKTDYSQYSYYGIRDDFKIDIKDPLSRIVMASMNRIAILDDLIILSPMTADVTGIFDAMSGNTPSVIDNAACRALADSLGDVLMATLTTSERIIYSDPSAQEERPMMYDFTVPADWGTLRGYEMAALGYRADGDNRYFDIALYYRDKSTAVADGRKIVNRMQTWKMGTYVGGTIRPDDSFMFTNWWQPGEPAVTAYGDGAVLKITCYPVSEVPRWISTLIGSSGIPFRDVLFLAPVPSEYVGKNS